MRLVDQLLMVLLKLRLKKLPVAGLLESFQIWGGWLRCLSNRVQQNIIEYFLLLRRRGFRFVQIDSYLLLRNFQSDYLRGGLWVFFCQVDTDATVGRLRRPSMLFQDPTWLFHITDVLTLVRSRWLRVLLILINVIRSFSLPEAKNLWRCNFLWLIWGIGKTHFWQHNLNFKVNNNFEY